MDDRVVIDGVVYSYTNRDYPNPYYKTDHGLYSVPESQFLDYLQREGTAIKDYWTGEQYRCFFRRNKDTNQTNDNISVYYPVDNGIRPGSLITHYGKTYLILNQESLENRVYHRSDGLNADIMLTTYNKETEEEISIPCFAYDLTGIVPEKSDMMSTINGNVEMMTGDCEASRKLRINDEFVAMGNAYSIHSVNFKTGIARIGASIIQGVSKHPVYALKIVSDDTYNQGEAVKLQANPTVDDFHVSNATLRWSSSNPEIITVTEDGNALFTGIGTCAIACHWEEHDITDTKYIEVIEEPEEPEYLCEIDGPEKAYPGREATFTAKFYGPDASSAVPVWSLEVPQEITKSVSISEQSGNEVTVKVNSGSGLVGYSFSLNLTDTKGQYHATKTIRISSFF